MIVAGIDYSMTCPAICIYDTKKELKFSNCRFFFYVDKKKFDTTFGTNIHGFQHKLYSSQQERFHNISEWAMSIMLKFGVKYATMEGYSMGSKGAVFDIGENGGLLKHKLWLNKIPFQCPAPTSVKKAFSGKGTSKKGEMHEHLKTSEDVDVSAIMDNSNPETSPVNDVVDAYAMVYYMMKSPESNYMN